MFVSLRTLLNLGLVTRALTPASCGPFHELGSDREQGACGAAFEAVAAVATGGARKRC